MNRYILTTTATVKPCDYKKWWMDGDIIKTKYITANTPQEALKIYAEEENKGYTVEISKNALKTKQPMYIEDSEGNTTQIGYVITGKTPFDKGDYSGYVDKYIDLWIEITRIEDAFTH